MDPQVRASDKRKCAQRTRSMAPQVRASNIPEGDPRQDSATWQGEHQFSKLSDSARTWGSMLLSHLAPRLAAQASRIHLPFHRYGGEVRSICVSTLCKTLRFQKYAQEPGGNWRSKSGER